MPADLILESVLVPSGSTPVPTIAAGAGAGTSPPAPVLTGGSNAWRGTASIGTGTTPAAGILATITFPAGMITSTSNQLPFVVLFPVNAASAGLEAEIEAVTASSFNIFAAVAPAASQALGTYQFSYIIFFQ